MNDKLGLSGATMRYENASQEPYKPIHIPTYEDTPENIAYCEKCPHKDCIYVTLEQCRTNECASKGKYTKTEKWKQYHIVGTEKAKSALMPIAPSKRC